MKYFILSDIHGSATALAKVLEKFYALNCDKIICLGDSLYHGPRNPLPEGYDNKKVCEMLNPLSDKIISCRGNCDAEVCEMVLNFSTMADYVRFEDGGIKIFCTHGHLYAPEWRMPENYDVFLYGHTHVQRLEKNSEGKIICNPGSIALPKGGSKAGFAVLETDNEVVLYDLDGVVLRRVPMMTSCSPSKSISA